MTPSKFKVIVSSEDREDWLQARTQGVTATDVARLANSGAAARATLLAEKLGKVRSFTGNVFTEHGKAREVVIAEWVEKVFGIEPCGLLLAAADNLRYLATPDGLGDDEGAEIKTTNKPWPDLDDVPRIYIDQSQWGMRVSGKSRWLFAWEEHENFVPTHMEPNWFWIERDDFRIAELENIADGFLAEMDAPYQPTEYDVLIAQYVARKQVVEQAQLELSEVDEKLRSMLAEKVSEKVVTPFGNLTWSTPKPRQIFDAAAFKVAQPATYPLFTKESQAKPSLRITEATI